MTPDDGNHEQILSRFRDWLTRTSREITDAADADRDGVEADQIGVREPGPARPPAAWPDVGLLQVVEALTAMRHELKLQTKNGRSLEDAVESARESLDAAMRQFQSVQAREEESARRAALPLVEILVGLDESLARGARACEATHRQLTESAPQQLCQSLDDQFRQLPWWRRWSLKAWHLHVQQHLAAAMVDVANEEFVRLLEGYRLIQHRVTQELQKAGVVRVATVGHPVDPHCMAVVELADESEGLPETVVAELRPGYRWRETVVRYAEVRAVQSCGRSTPADQDTDPAYL